MLYSLSLYVALTIFGLGLIHKISTWFRYGIGTDALLIPTSQRVTEAIRGIVATLLSGKILTLLRVLVLEVIFQARTFREDRFRWLMHMCIYGGFMVLLLMHGLSKFTSELLFADYYPTLNPFRFLRDLGAMVVIFGLFLALVRRYSTGKYRPATSAMDLHAILILAAIMISGILLEGTKIVSPKVFQSMVQDYLTQPEEAEILALTAYWVRDFGAVSPDLQGPFDPKIIQDGRLIHEMNCMQCHSRPQWAVAGYTVSRLFRPLAVELDQAGLPTILWHLHFLSCFLGLAYLPFSKMFHIFASPLSLMVNAVMDHDRSAPANVATKQIIELDACVHCGACTQRCSVAVAFGEIPNVNILPSEKISSLQALAAGRELGSGELRTIQQGLFLCTNCNRCTLVCPVGIRLREMWGAARERLLLNSLPEPLLLSPFSLSRGLTLGVGGDTEYRKPVDLVKNAVTGGSRHGAGHDLAAPLSFGPKALLSSLRASIQANSFSRCHACMTCSNACPVVRNYRNPREILGLLPHQLMYAIGRRQWDLIFGATMLWDCLGCYQCQENCPQNVEVADILYELKSVAISRWRGEPA